MRSSAIGLLIVLFSASTGLATPERWGEVTITPVAANQKGQVLFKTVSRFLPSPEDYCRTPDDHHGWLVVSADGVWHEATQLQGGWKSHPTDGMALEKGDDLLIDRFRSTTNWDNPGEPLATVVKLWGFSRKDAVQEELGKGDYTWLRDYILGGERKVRGSIPQRTIFNNLSSPSSWFGKIDCSFHFQGVALFRNGIQVGGKTVGAVPPMGDDFFAPDGKPHPLGENRSEESYDWYPGEVDGICVIPAEVR